MVSEKQRISSLFHIFSFPVRITNGNIHLCLGFLFLINNNYYYLLRSIASGCAWLPQKLLGKTTVNHSNSGLRVAASYYNYSLALNRKWSRVEKRKKKKPKKAKGRRGDLCKRCSLFLLDAIPAVAPPCLATLQGISAANCISWLSPTEAAT